MEDRRERLTTADQQLVVNCLETAVAREIVSGFRPFGVFGISPVLNYACSIVNYIVPRISIVTGNMSYTDNVGRQLGSDWINV